MKPNKLKLNEKGQHEITYVSKSTNKDFTSHLIEYLNKLKPLFDKAKESNEFEYACSLIGFKGLSDPGWDTFDNTVEIFDSVNRLKNKTKDSFTKLNLFLWVYGHIIEASRPYELYANLLRIIDGKSYIINNFPDKVRGNHTVPQFPIEKIEHLEELATKVKMESVLDPVKDIFDKNLRNSIFHSDYSIYQKEIRAYKRFSSDETYLILNKALAYFESFKILYFQAIKDYSESKLVELPSRFSFKNGALIVRKDHGLIGFKDNHTKEQLKAGALPFRMGTFKYHELEILKRDSTVCNMPIDITQKYIDLYNKYINLIPRFLEKPINRIFRKMIRNIQIYLIVNTVANTSKSRSTLKQNLKKSFRSNYD
jgi:hypothetical protein